ncbi:MAG TPA: DUF3488 and transglutaminase-like domain-containing protein [Mycobacteriales bacterium]|nr:DUF3488 and transglutaminase-like domain-containing protein [Mycobacteriales bacterium]
MRTTTRLTLAAALATFLGALPLAGGFSEHRWLWYALLSVAVVAGIGLLTRAARVAPGITLLAQLLGLLFLHTLAFEHAQAIFGFIPTGASISALRDAVQNGMNDIQYLAAPVPARQDIVILTSLSVGLIALVVDIIAVTFRRPAVSGLALLALFAVATAVSDGVPWLMFLAAGGGYLVLLAVEGREHLVRWGRMVTPSGEPDSGLRGVPKHSAAGRVGMAALALALIVPLLIPGFSRNVLENIGSGDGGDHGAGQTGNSINPFTSLRGDLTQPDARDLLKIHTDSPPQYLRTSVLSEFTSKGWRAGRIMTYGPSTGLSGQLQVPPEVENLDHVGSARTAQAEVTVKAYDGAYLPTYYTPTRISGLDDSWRYLPDRGEIRGRSALTPNRTYTIDALEPHPSRISLESEPPINRNDPIMDLWGQVPDSVRPGVKDITQSVIKGQTTPWGKASALNDYFLHTGGFTYSLQTTQGGSSDGLLNFLRTKQGYCEQFASAMGIMLRIAGIPSRVVLGYTPGTQNSDGSWTITNHDAHAWVEAYFGRLGWVQFDPTPLADGRGSTQEFLPGSDQPTDTPGTQQPSNTGTAPTTKGTNSIPAGTAGPTGGGGAGHSHGTTTPTIIGLTAAAVLLAVLLLAPGVTRRLIRRRRLAAAADADPGIAAHAAWTEVLATALDHRIRLPRSESPRATASRLLGARELPRPAESALRLLALAEERARYARTPGVEGDLPTALRALIRGLGSGVSRLDRVRILVAPVSVRDAAMGALDRGKVRARMAGRNLLRLITPRRHSTEP